MDAIVFNDGDWFLAEMDGHAGVVELTATATEGDAAGQVTLHMSPIHAARAAQQLLDAADAAMEAQ